MVFLIVVFLCIFDILLIPLQPCGWGKGQAIQISSRITNFIYSALTKKETITADPYSVSKGVVVPRPSRAKRRGNEQLLD